ncbi:flippase, partial [Vibrio breoganii]|uniref:flippase n=1 Tax=Vibrio breoganii TaxID=553239 RepID=UPI001055C6ED
TFAISPWAKYLMGEAWPLILASALYIVFTKIDQIMLGELVGSESVGIYAAAVKISEGWYFVPGMIATSLYPLMLKAKKRSRKSYIDITQQLLNVMVLIAVLAAVFIGIISSNLINLTFGQYYSESANILIAHIWGGVFIAIGGVSYRYLIAEGLQKYSFYRALFGAIVNICLNLFLIPRYGATGAAVATVLSQFMTLYLFNSLNKATRELFYMQSKALSLTGTPSTIRFLKGLRNS